MIAPSHRPPDVDHAPWLQVKVAEPRHYSCGQQSLTVEIKPPGNLDTLDRHKLVQGPPLALRGELAKHAVRLVEENDGGHEGLNTLLKP